eukprot:SM000144S00671  [mRNA]  locus=s144:84282:90877:+ [translate_table: standard]
MQLGGEEGDLEVIAELHVVMAGEQGRVWPALGSAVDGGVVVVEELAGGGVDGEAQRRRAEAGAAGERLAVCPDAALLPYLWKRHLCGAAAHKAGERARWAAAGAAPEPRPGCWASTHLGAQLCRLRASLDAFVNQREASQAGAGGTLRAAEDAAKGAAAPPAPPASLQDAVRSVRLACPGLRLELHSRVAWQRLALRPSPVARDFGSALPSVQHVEAGGPRQQPAQPAAVSSTPGAAAPTAKGGTSDDGPAAVLLACCPGVLQSALSLLPPGSAQVDAIAVFSEDEAPSNVHPWGRPSDNVFRLLTLEVGKARLTFTQKEPPAKALESLLRWVFSCRTLFTLPCSALVSGASEVLNLEDSFDPKV